MDFLVQFFLLNNTVSILSQINYFSNASIHAELMVVMTIIEWKLYAFAMIHGNGKSLKAATLLEFNY